MLVQGWLARPWADITARLEMIPALMAEESLRRVTEIAAGNGLIKDPDRGNILRGWRRDAQMGSMAEPQKTTLDSLIGHGIGLQIVKKGKPRG